MRDPVRAWLFGIARRAAMDRLRRHYAEPAAEAEPDDTPAPDDTEGLAEEIELMHEELAHLPIVEREVLVFFNVQELAVTYTMLFTLGMLALGRWGPAGRAWLYAAAVGVVLVAAALVVLVRARRRWHALDRRRRELERQLGSAGATS